MESASAAVEMMAVCVPAQLMARACNVSCTVFDASGKPASHRAEIMDVALVFLQGIKSQYDIFGLPRLVGCQNFCDDAAIIDAGARVLVSSVQS